MCVLLGCSDRIKFSVVFYIGTHARSLASESEHALACGPQPNTTIQSSFRVVSGGLGRRIVVNSAPALRYGNSVHRCTECLHVCGSRMRTKQGEYVYCNNHMCRRRKHKHWTHADTGQLALFGPTDWKADCEVKARARARESQWHFPGKPEFTGEWQRVVAGGGGVRCNHDAAPRISSASVCASKEDARARICRSNSPPAALSDFLFYTRC